MKNTHYILLPLMALLALGSCKQLDKLNTNLPMDSLLTAHAAQIEAICNQYNDDYFSAIADSFAIAGREQKALYEQQAQSQQWNDLAKYLVGMRLDSTNRYQHLTQHATWTAYQQKMWTTWHHFKKNADIAAEWQKENIAPLTSGCRQLLYTFSGPDWVYANTFFPDVDEYILLAAEPIGNIPQPKDTITAKEAQLLGEALYRTTRNIWGNSFFITGKMEKDLRNKEVDGVTPVLMMFMGRYYRNIDDIAIGRLLADGSIDTSADVPNAVRILNSKNGKQQTITYIKCDLSNKGLEKDTVLTAYLERQVEDGCASYLKAASYLPHYNSFSRIRNIVLAKSRFILTDDSGIKYSHLLAAGFDCKLFGTYTQPIKTFKNCIQPDLAAAYQLEQPDKLDFQIGYGNRYSLIGALKKVSDK